MTAVRTRWPTGRIVLGIAERGAPHVVEALRSGDAFLDLAVTKR